MEEKLGRCGKVKGKGRPLRVEWSFLAPRWAVKSKSYLDCKEVRVTHLSLSSASGHSWLALDRNSVKAPSTEGKDVALCRRGSATAFQNAAGYAEQKVEGLIAFSLITIKGKAYPGNFQCETLHCF